MTEPIQTYERPALDLQEGLRLLRAAKEAEALWRKLALKAPNGSRRVDSAWIDYERAENLSSRWWWQYGEELILAIEAPE